MKFHLFILFWLAAVFAATGDDYADDSNVYELTPSNFDKVVHKTNYTSIVKFYAPWCGYCQKLKPTWKKLGKLVKNDGKYAVNVAAVNCDKEYNKPLCSKHRVSGFPTVMVFRPPKYDPNSKSKVYRHTIEPYNGDRSLKALHNFISSSVKNYVKKFPNLNSDSLQEWLQDNANFKKVLLITESQTLSALYKSLAIDFIDTVKFGMTTLKSLKGVTPIKATTNGVETEIPIEEGDKLPKLLTFDEKKGKYVQYDRKNKLNDKLDITKWLIEVHGVQPLEGELSTRFQKYHNNFVQGKKAKKIQHDEL